MFVWTCNRTEALIDFEQDVWHVVVIDGDKEAAPVLVHDFELDGVEVAESGPDSSWCGTGSRARNIAGGITACLILVASRHA